MKSKKSILPKLIILFVILAAIAALVLFVFIPIFTQQETTYGEEPEIFSYTGDGKPLTMESERLLFEMDPTTTQFRVTDKKNGKVWFSNPEDRDKDPIALTLNKDALSSTFNVTYTNSSGEVELNNYTYSMQNQTFDVILQEDGSIRVDYAIGQIEREFMIPTVITKERYEEFSEKMSKKTRKKVGSNYSLSEPAKLDKAKNKDEILARCPSAAEVAVYLLKTDTTTSTKEMVENGFKEAGYTAEDKAVDDALMQEQRSNNGYVFNASVIYRLEGDDMVVEVPYSSFKCMNGAPLTYISVLPMFGAAGTEREGFMLVPEGGGALINFNNGKVTQNAYYANLYGWDYATERTEVVSETCDAFPVFGIGEEDGSFICILEGASAYGGICADIAGRYNSYNTVYAKSNVLHCDRFNVSARTAELLYMYEKAIPDDTLVQRYRFLEGGDYVTMAKAYGDYLKAKPESKKTEVSENMPVNMELVGAINKMMVKFGMPVDSVVSVTSFDQAASIMNELTDSGVKDMNLRMTGWSNGGIRQQVLTSVRTVGEIGGDKGMKKLIAEAKAKGVNLTFDGINCFAYDSGVFEGFLPFSHAARLTTREQVKLYNYDIVTYKQSEWQDPYYLVRPDYAASNADNLIRALQDKGAAGIAFRDIGNLLSADYYNRATTTRQQTLLMNVETLKKAVEAGLRITIREGNDYAVPYVDMITDMRLTGNAYTILDKQIPFYQIALHGFRNYTGEAINLAGDYQTALLECAEYGAGLNFTFMKEDTMILQDTQYSCYTSAAYDRWKEEVIPMILRYQSEMGDLNRKQITGHERLTSKVTVTVYEDGTRVYVNYGDSDYADGTINVSARDYKVERGTGK